MDGPPGRETYILKVLSGVQIGAELSLAPGEYVLGSGAEDDVQFIDVSVRPGHMRLRIEPQTLSARAEADIVTLDDGASLAPTDDWRVIQPLDIIRLGAVTFAIGLPNARWSTVAEEIAPRSATPPPPSGAATRAGVASRLKALLSSDLSRAMALPVVTSLGLILFALWFVLGPQRTTRNPRDDAAREFQTVREALAQLPFAREIEARQELDGRIFVSGYVGTAPERRAAAAAIEKTGVPAHLRLEVLDFLRSEIDNLIAQEKVKVGYVLSPRGELTLNGVILSEAEAARFLSRLRDSVIGLKKIDSGLRTAPMLLKEIQRLAHVSQVDQKVIFRLEQNVVEANGVIGSDKIDAWVGFLQAYSKHLSADIGLRSFVQLQVDKSVAGAQLPPDGVGPPIAIGPEAGPGQLDIDRLRDGRFKLSDIFAGTVGGGADRVANAGQTPAAAPGGFRLPAPPAWDPGAQIRPAESDRAVAPAPPEAPLFAQLGPAAATSADAPPTSAPPAAGLPSLLAGRWFAPAASPAPNAPLLAQKGAAASAGCRPHSPLTPATVAWALERLDRMSVAPEKADALEPARARILLEVALDPFFAARCLQRARPDADPFQTSAYLAEIARNPGFAAVVTRDFPSYDLAVSGVNLTRRRFLQTKDGAKLAEGAAPDETSRLEAVGELGAVLRTGSGFARALYIRGANWVVGAAAQGADAGAKPPTYGR